MRWGLLLQKSEEREDFHVLEPFLARGSMEKDSDTVDLLQWTCCHFFCLCHSYIHDDSICFSLPSFLGPRIVGCQVFSLVPPLWFCSRNNDHALVALTDESLFGASNARHQPSCSFFLFPRVDSIDFNKKTWWFQLCKDIFSPDFIKKRAFKGTVMDPTTLFRILHMKKWAPSPFTGSSWFSWFSDKWGPHLHQPTGPRLESTSDF